MSSPAEPITAMIAEDEPLLAKSLVAMLRELWPELQVAAMADNGVAAIEQATQLAPDVMFLDIKMPGKSGLDVAEIVADEWPQEAAEPLFVFVTAYDEFAVPAFERAAIDYILKPVTPDRLRRTVERLQQRLATRAPSPAAGQMATVCKRMQAISASDAPPERIKVIRASVGNTVRMIPVADIMYLEAADKYVNVVTAGGEALVRMSLRELASRLEGIELVQVHRSVMVNASHMASATRDELGHFTLSLRGSSRTVSVSRAFSYLFRPM